MEIINGKVLGSRNLTLTNPETGVVRKFKLFAIEIPGEEEGSVQNIEVWADPEDSARRGQTVGVSEDESGRWNIWF